MDKKELNSPEIKRIMPFRIDYQQLAESCKLLGKNAEVIADFTGPHRHDQSRANENDVLTLISRCPCSVEDIAGGLNVHPNEVIKYIHALISNGIIEETRHSGKIFYVKTSKIRKRG